MRYENRSGLIFKERISSFNTVAIFSYGQLVHHNFFSTKVKFNFYNTATIKQSECPLFLLKFIT